MVKLIRQNTKGIVKVNITGFAKKSLNITYESHRDATLARKQIISDALQEWNINLCIDINGPPSPLSENQCNENYFSYSTKLREPFKDFSENQHNVNGFSPFFYSVPNFEPSTSQDINNNDLSFYSKP